MEVVRRFRVWGRVQGVGFRAFVWRSAAKVGVSGWARNRHDGSVEVLAKGEPERLDSLLKLLGEGPRFARVDRVERGEEDSATDVGTGFSIRPDA